MRIPFKERIRSVMNGGSKRSDQTVESVDLVRYSGKWYEIASFPTWFESGCRCSSANYIMRDGFMEVRNSCERDGTVSMAAGKAYPVPGSGNSRLKVRFRWPFKGDYWIIGLDENYQHAVVGHPRKKYLWILSRTPDIDEDTYQALIETARRKGYDTTKLERSNPSCMF